MAYSLTAQIDPSWVQLWAPTVPPNPMEMKLCFAFGMGYNAQAGEGKVTYNVVAASTAVVSPYITITWSDTYQISATNMPVKPGGTIFSAISSQPIDFQMRLNLPQPFGQPPPPVPAEEAPQKGFIFGIPSFVTASAILSKPISTPGVSAEKFNMPFFLSVAGPLPEGNQILVPHNSIRLWWQSAVLASTTVDPKFAYSSAAIELQYDPSQTQITASFSATGNWSSGTTLPQHMGRLAM